MYSFRYRIGDVKTRGTKSKLQGLYQIYNYECMGRAVEVVFGACHAREEVARKLPLQKIPSLHLSLYSHILLNCRSFSKTCRSFPFRRHHGRSPPTMVTKYKIEEES
ncbi:hypothetical protein IMY05_010G0200300 [Salix suchowensis]|nr:hypothetical protein IMY05_010G0200300 [Salix suchowensis]